MKINGIALAVAILGALMLLAAGPGTRLELWDYGTGFLLMRIALFTGLAGAAFAAILMVVPKTRSAGLLSLAAALVIGLGTAWVPYDGYRTVRSLPFIHDITTDTQNPPQFVDIVALRVDAKNPVAYEGEEVAKQQREGYPDIQPLQLASPVAGTFAKALGLVEAMGWELVAQEADEGRIEATATTQWFGFKDDVVIRIVPSPTGSRLDIRSKSRVGRSDVGANAARIRAFIAGMTEPR